MCKDVFTSNFKFVPDAELLKFADEFSKVYKLYSAGDYFSDNKKYHIRYLDTLEKSNTPARVCINNGKIELVKDKLLSEKYTSDYVFYIIFWCIIETKVTNLKVSDKVALDYYATTGRSIKNVLKGILYSFNNAKEVLTDYNNERYLKMIIIKIISAIIAVCYSIKLFFKIKWKRDIKKQESELLKKRQQLEINKKNGSEKNI